MWCTDKKEHNTTYVVILPKINNFNLIITIREVHGEGQSPK